MFTIETTEAFDFCSHDYRELFARSDASAFQHPDWMHAMATQLGPSMPADLLIVTIREEQSGTLVALLPFTKRAIGPFKLLEFLNFGVVDHACAILDVSFCEKLLRHEDKYTDELTDKLSKALTPYNIVWIKHVRERDLWILSLFPKSWIAAKADFSSHATELGDNFADWKLSHLSANRRHDLKRKRARLAKLGALEFRLLQDPAEIKAAFSFLQKVRKRRFEHAEGKDFLQEKRFYDFYSALAENPDHRDLAVTACLTLDGAIIAASFGILKGDHFTFLLPGADYERFSRGSPGKVQIDYLIEYLMEKGIQTFDFSIGDEAYKTTFGTSPEAIFTIMGYRGPIGRLGLALIKIAKKAKALLSL